jgi:hypothetical protein
VEELSENKIVILPEQEEDDELTFEGETEEFEEE